MNVIESLEKEVSDAANQMTAEVVLLLLDKWERDLEKAIETNSAEVLNLLNTYVRLKISLHHVLRKYEGNWFYDIESQHNAEATIIQLRNRIKESRRKYYVAKQRFESDQHGSECSCRGCNCIAGINRGSSRPVGQGSN